MQEYVMDLLNSVERAEPMLLRISVGESARRPAPGKWSPREIVGHLVDPQCAWGPTPKRSRSAASRLARAAGASASNNHQRFVRARWQDDLIFEGYAQDAWVAAQRYQEAPWPELVALWALFNRHLARVMAAVPESTRTRRHIRHNLHQLAWQPVPETEPATLDYFMQDYVAHLQHHMRQILGADWSA